MANPSPQMFQYSLRVIGMLLALPLLSALPILGAWAGLLPRELNGWLVLLWVVAVVAVWRLGWRKLLVEGRYRCPGCGEKCARFESRTGNGKSEVYLVCDTCGCEELTKSASETK